MGFIEINTISLQPPPAIPKAVTVMYRLLSDADIPANYTIVTNSLIVPVGGVLLQPFFINGLADGVTYVVRIKSDCGNYAFEKQFTTGVACPQPLSIVTDDLIAYWGWKNNPNVLSEATIVSAPLYQHITATQNIECDFSGGSASPQYLWMAEPVAAQSKIKWADVIDPYNHGNIGTGQDLFDASTVTPNFRFYITVYPTQQNHHLTFNTA